MQLIHVPLRQTRSFSEFFLDYVDQKEDLRPFYNRFPSQGNFLGQIHDKRASFKPEFRTILVNELARQYEGVKANQRVTDNIQSLGRPTTFTVTTGHQLNIFTGPLYFIYKIVTVINASKTLKQLYPEFDFVPVYWMASEDHDYDEIKSFRLYGKKYTWSTEQQGAVGRFSTDGLKSLMEDMPGDIAIFWEAYQKGKTLGEAVRRYVDALFGTEGLVVVDGDTRAFKSLFGEVVKDDLTAHIPKTFVEQTNRQLEGHGYKPQVYCRDINFFFLDGNLRSRIERNGDRYGVVDTALSFTETEILNQVESCPEKFSPNVILRPLYQEWILPNLAYTGGPAEVVYWLQLKGVFDHYKVPFPILLPRNFAMIVEQPVWRKMKKAELEMSDLFEDTSSLFNQWVLRHSDHTLTTGDERAAIDRIFAMLKQRAESIDSTLAPHVAAEGKRAINSLEKIEKKFLRAGRRVHAEKQAQIEAVKNALFPNGGLQERVDNFLNFFQKDPDFIRKLLNCFDPFDLRFNVLLYEDE